MFEVYTQKNNSSGEEACKSQNKADLLMRELCEILLRPVEELETTVHTYNVLKNKGVVTIADFVSKSEGQILHGEGGSRKVLNEANELLSPFGLRVGMKFGTETKQSVFGMLPSYKRELKYLAKEAGLEVSMPKSSELDPKLQLEAAKRLRIARKITREHNH